MKNIFLKIWWKIDIILFPITQKMGFHITKTHYYSPIPSTNELDKSLWNKPRYNRGINFNDQNQKNLLKKLSSRYKNEYDKFCISKNETKSDKEYYINNGLFESVDAEILYSIIRDIKPKKVFEIGSGFSTLVIARALTENKKRNNIKSYFLSFDPNPQKFLNYKINGLTSFKKTKAQNIPLSLFQKLKENDVLFIDSSHIAKIGSDVLYEYLEVLPSLKKGVFVHIHDIFLPLEYPRNWIIKFHMFSTEQYLLHAFLIFNSKFKIIWGSKYMEYNHKNLLKRAFRSYDNSSAPESFWMKKIK